MFVVTFDVWGGLDIIHFDGVVRDDIDLGVVAFLLVGSNFDADFWMMAFVMLDESRQTSEGSWLTIHLETGEGIDKLSSMHPCVWISTHKNGFRVLDSLELGNHSWHIV